MASKIRKFLDIQGLLKLIRLVKNNEQPHWIGTQAEYDSQKANIPNGAIVALTDEEDTTYDHGKYSTVETVTGQRWIDGKPIYRKTITGTNIAANSAVDLSNVFGKDYIDKLIDLSGYAWNDSWFHTFNSGYAQAYYNPHGGNNTDRLYINNPTGAAVSEWKLVMEYTKTSD